MINEKELLEKFYRASVKAYNMMIDVQNFQGYDVDVEKEMLSVMTQYNEYVETYGVDKYVH
jgi:hypothetical protein